MSFQDDIFISYAHIDNRPLGDSRGWIDCLFERLKVRLAQLLGEEPVIWWDGRLQGDQYFAGVIGDRVSHTLLLVPVVTPRYLNSEWCRGELREFCERALATGGLAPHNHSRIFKIVKTPVNDEQLPGELRGLLGYVFYELDANERPREYSPDASPYKDPKYWAKLEDLAWDIKQALENLKYKAGPAASGAAATAAAGADAPDAAAAAGDLPLRKKVYLAEATADLDSERDRVKRELQQRGYYVLPDRELPLRSPEIEEEARDYLRRSALSVHLIGESYGIIPEGEEERSVVRLQEELAAERGAADPSFSRVVWMPTGLKARGARQQRFVEELQTRLGAGAELLQTTLEDLKTRINEKLEPPPPPAAASASAAGREGRAAPELTRVYLICDNRDMDDVVPVEEYLYTQGYEVITSINEGDGAQVAQYHRENLLNCDATLIYYGSANQLWLRSKLWDLQKAPGWGRTRPMRAKAIYVSAPATTEKQRFRTREVPLVMQNFSAFSPDALRPFIQAIGAGDGGQE